MKFTPTPSAASSFVAGIGLWTLAWTFVAKLDALAKLMHCDRFINADKLLDWISEHKGVSLIATEMINIGSHGMGTDPLGVTFSLGGTIVNAFVICLLLPMRKMAKRVCSMGRTDVF
jgi:hypothetical protein